MQFKKPKDDNKYSWTNHVVDKMQYYGISESLIKRVVRNPNRVEEGVAENTNASMQPRKVKAYSAGKPVKWEEEIWVMWQEIAKRSPARDSGLGTRDSNPKSWGTNFLRFGLQSKLRIISAWRYPGMSPERSSIPIPDDILMEIENVL